MKKLITLLMLLLLSLASVPHLQAQDPAPFLDSSPAWDYGRDTNDNASQRVEGEYFNQADTVNHYGTLQNLCPAPNANWRLALDAFTATGDEIYNSEMVEMMQQTEACYVYYGVTEAQLGSPYIQTFTISPGSVGRGILMPHLIGTIKLNRATLDGFSIAVNSQNNDILNYHQVIIVQPGYNKVSFDMGTPSDPGHADTLGVTTSGGPTAHVVIGDSGVSFYATPSTIMSNDLITLTLIVNDHTSSDQNSLSVTQSSPAIVNNTSATLNLTPYINGTSIWIARVRFTANSVSSPRAGYLSVTFRGVEYRAGVIVQPSLRGGANGDVFYRFTGGDTTFYQSQYWGASPIALDSNPPIAIAPVLDGWGDGGGSADEVFHAYGDFNAAPVGQSSWEGNPWQEWNFVPSPFAGQGFFHIVNYYSGKCLNVTASNLENTVDGISIYDCYDDAENEDFAFINVNTSADPQYVIMNKHSGKVLTIPYGSTDSGVSLSQWDYVGQMNQKFRLYPF